MKTTTPHNKTKEETEMKRWEANVVLTKDGKWVGSIRVRVNAEDADIANGDAWRKAAWMVRDEAIDNLIVDSLTEVPAKT